MAWNEPGGNNNDPWKNRGGRDQGPPDLHRSIRGLGIFYLAKLFWAWGSAM